MTRYALMADEVSRAPAFIVRDESGNELERAAQKQEIILYARVVSGGVVEEKEILRSESWMDITDRMAQELSLSSRSVPFKIEASKKNSPYFEAFICGWNHGIENC
jgi:hypothetical protein